jgi:predicted RNA-binding Zn-ribbon protein involved in translation (DUF1610 family)
MKTNKHQTLLLVKKNGFVQAKDIVSAFNYSPATARSYLSYLLRQDLLKRTISGHELTAKGENRLYFFEVEGCGNPSCPLCEDKTGNYTCPTCGYSLQKKKARLRPTWDTVLFHREAGVYCPLCQGQIFNEQQARLMDIAEEKQ